MVLERRRRRAAHFEQTMGCVGAVAGHGVVLVANVGEHGATLVLAWFTAGQS